MTALPVPNPSRAGTRKTDWCLYKERGGIECLFGKMKHFSRFDTLARRYLASFISSPRAASWGRMSTEPSRRGGR